jgi:hypothetical protein
MVPIGRREKIAKYQSMMNTTLYKAIQVHKYE